MPTVPEEEWGWNGDRLLSSYFHPCRVFSFCILLPVIGGYLLFLNNSSTPRHFWMAYLLCYYFLPDLLLMRC